MSRRIEPYWILILLFVAIAAGLFAYHLATGNTPPRAAFSVFGLPIYWYGIWIVSGIALGAYVVSRLAEERAEKRFVADVPAEVRERPLDETALPEDLRETLTAQKAPTLGEALWRWGLDPNRLNVRKDDRARLQEALAAEPGVKPEWLNDASWRQWNPDHVWNGLLYCLILGVIGARLYHVLTPSPSMAAVGINSAQDFLRDPIQILNLRSGGLGIYGAIAGGLLGLFIYTRRQRISTLAWADLAVVGLALGQSVGRWGNFFNQELYGRPANLPWSIQIDPVHRLPDVANFTHFHPAFLYESIWMLLTFFLLHRLARRRADRMLPGELMALYLVSYALGRTLIETVRLDSRTIHLLGLELNLAVATLVSLIVATVAVIWVLARRLMRRRASPQVSVG